MTIHKLDSLLLLIRDGVATPDDVRRARSLVRVDERLPEELREIALVEDVREDAVALLAVLGHDDGFGALMSQAILSESLEPEAVSEVEPPNAQVLDLNESMETELARPFDWPLGLAIAYEAGRVEMARPVLEALGLEYTQYGTIADTIRAEAGQVELATRVLDGRGFWTPIAAAIAAEAGQVEIVAAVLAELGLSSQSAALSEAIVSEAGTIDVAVSVTNGIVHDVSQTTKYSIGDAIRASAGDVGELWPAIALAIESENNVPIRQAIVAEAGTIDLIRPVMDEVQRDSLGVVTELPLPANSPRWGFAALLSIAAAALVMFGVQATVGELPMEPTIAPLQFAAASEVVVHELEYSEHVQVFQVEGDEGAMILWVDEEAVL